MRAPRVANPIAGERPHPVPNERSAFARVASLSWPIAVAMLGDTAMGLVDTTLVGQLGASALGGVGIATTLMWLGYVTVFGLMRGVKVRASHAVGEGRRGAAIAYAYAGILMGALAGVVLWIASRDVRGVLLAIGIDSGMAEQGSAFLRARTYGAPWICVYSALVQYRQGIGDSRSPMIVGLTGNLLNAGLAYALIHGRFGLPALGVAGAGYGTAVAEATQALLLLYLLAREARAAAAARSKDSVLPLRQAAAEVASLGVPTGLQFGAEMLAFTTFTAILGSIGPSEIAAHQVAIAVLRTSFLPGLAVAEAGSVLVGQALGRRCLAEADRVTAAALTLAVGFMTACGVVFAVAGGPIARFFTTDSSVAEIARRLLLVAAIFQTLDATTTVLRSALRAAKDVRVVAIIGIGVAWCCIPGAAYLLGRRAGYGAVGGWCGFILETTIAATLFGWRWKRGSWRAAYPVPALVIAGGARVASAAAEPLPTPAEGEPAPASL